MLIIKFIVFVFFGILIASLFGAIAGLIASIGRILIGSLRKMPQNYLRDYGNVISKAVSLSLLALYISHLAATIDSDSSVFYFIGGFIFLEQCAVLYRNTRKKIQNDILGGVFLSWETDLEKKVYALTFFGYILLCFIPQSAFEAMTLFMILNNVFEWIYDIPVLEYFLIIIAGFYVLRSMFGLYFMIGIKVGDMMEKNRAKNETPEETEARHKRQMEDVRQMFSPSKKGDSL